MTQVTLMFTTGDSTSRWTCCLINVQNDVHVIRCSKFMFFSPVFGYLDDEIIDSRCVICSPWNPKKLQNVAFEVSFDMFRPSKMCIQTYSNLRVTGWWFGTFYIFPYIGNNHPNWLIFFRGVETTNQVRIIVNSMYLLLRLVAGDCPSWFLMLAALARWERQWLVGNVGGI